MQNGTLISAMLIGVIAFCSITARAGTDDRGRTKGEQVRSNSTLIDKCRVLIDLETKLSKEQQMTASDRDVWLRGAECGAYLEGFADRTLAEEAVHKRTCLVGHNWDRLALAKIYVAWMDKRLMSDPKYLKEPITHTVMEALEDAFPCS